MALSPHDPWLIEAERAVGAPGFRRPDVSAVPRPALYALGGLAASRALGLVLVAEAIARGIAALAAGGMDAGTIRLVLILGASGAVLRAGAEWAGAVLARRIATRVKTGLRKTLWRRITDSEARGGGAAVLAADGLDALDDYFVQAIPAVISAAVVPLVVGLRILGADWPSAVIVALTVPLVPLFMVLIGKHTQLRTDAALNALTRLADHLTELARGLPVLVGLGRVAEQTAALDGIQRRYRERTSETLRWAFLSALALELIATLSVAVVAVVLGLRLLNGTVPLEAALIALLLAPECFAALREVGTAFHTSQDGLSVLERAQGILTAPRKTDRRERGPFVRVEGLEVRYARRTSAALDAVTADLRGITAITGPSGAGKSTLLAALAGVLPGDPVASGRIVGVDPAAVGWAPQSPRAFATTAGAELALYGGDSRLLAELGMAELADAAVAELSPGEQRCLAVARALARVDAGARLLILDEPTAHLDAASAELVRAAVRRRASRCIVVFASHEPETLALATHEVRVGGTAPKAARASAEAPRSEDSVAPRPGGKPLRSSGAEVHPRALGLRSLLGADAGTWAASVLLGALATGFGLTLTALSGWLIVRASIEQHIMYLLVAIVGVRAFGIGRAVGRYAERLVTHTAAFRSIDRLRLRLWRALAARGAGSRRLLEGGAPLDYLVTLADDLRDQLPRVIAPIGAGIVTTAGAIVTTALLAPGLAPTVASVLIAAVALAAVLAIVSERGAGARRVSARSQIVRGTAALSDAASDLRGNGVDGAALAGLDAMAETAAGAERRAAWSAGLAAAVVAFVTALLAAAVPVLAADLPAEQAAVLALLSLALPEPLAALVAAVHRVPVLRSLLAAMGPVLAPAPSPKWGSGQPRHPVQTLSLDAVTIRYPGVAAPAVEGVSGAAQRGARLVLAGPSGSGKSTLLSAVMGALPIAEGEIRADGAPLTGLAERAWRDRVAWCPQDAYVFDSSIRGNLLLARPRADAPQNEELHHALAQAGLSTLLQTLPEGLDTRAGAGGSALSGGERQRLAVARALLTHAEVILLDEPTAHLDAPTAVAMMADVRAATVDRVVVLVSHRIADRHPDDVIVVLPGR